jgi:hypothetical protein
MKTPDNSQSSPNKLPLEASHKKGEKCGAVAAGLPDLLFFARNVQLS